MFNKILNKLKIGSHYRIERFGWIFSLLSFGMLICLGFAWRAQMNINKIDFKSRAVYAPAFETSRTHNSGSVVGVFSNTERTKAFVLLKMKNMDELPADAKDYRMYITNDSMPGNPRKSDHKPSGSIYMFGTSGYMGLYIIDKAGFEQAIKKITVRIGKELVTVDSNKIQGDAVDESFAKYDQFNIHINFGADFGDKMVQLDENSPDELVNVGLKESDVLSGDKIEATKIFKTLVIDPQEKDIKAVLLNDLKDMQNKKKLIAEYTERYETLDIDGKHGIVPEEPMEMRGDEITDVKGLLYLKPSYVYPNGYDFVWQNRSIEDGYLKDVVPAGDSALNFMIQHDKAVSETTETKQELWYLSDGSLLSTYEDNGGTQYKVVSDAMNLRDQIVKFWADYIGMKKTYQITDLRSLLELEIVMRAVDRNYTVNDATDTLLSY